MGECFFWYWPTRVVLDTGPFNGCMRVPVCAPFVTPELFTFYSWPKNLYDESLLSVFLSDCLHGCGQIFLFYLLHDLALL